MLINALTVCFFTLMNHLNSLFTKLPFGWRLFTEEKETRLATWWPAAATSSTKTRINLKLLLQFEVQEVAAAGHQVAEPYS